MFSNKLRCPVCGTDTGTSGAAFGSDWAVACHVAGCALSGYRDHESWALRYVTASDLKRSLPQLAELLLPHVLEEEMREHAEELGRVVGGVTLLVQVTERGLYSHVRRRLEESFGRKKDRWWTRGVPLQIRQDSAQRREEDDCADHAYAYTRCTHVTEIIDRNWTLFEADFARVRDSRGPEGTNYSKTDLLEDILRFCRLRGRWVHSVRAPHPESEEFPNFKKELLETLEIIEKFCSA